jgi:GTP-binding protein
LGVVRLSAMEEFVLADIPGLIEGAHEGAGLGTRFLGHVERCAVLLHLVDGAAGDVVRAWRTVREELAAYGGGLADKAELIGLNKVDAMTPREATARRTALAKASGRRVMLLSGVTGQGVPEALRALQSMIDAGRQDQPEKLPLPLREGVGGRGSRPTLAAPSPQPPPARGGGVFDAA